MDAFQRYVDANKERFIAESQDACRQHDTQRSSIDLQQPCPRYLFFRFATRALKRLTPTPTNAT